jgi:hypothetical protein
MGLRRLSFAAVSLLVLTACRTRVPIRAPSGAPVPPTPAATAAAEPPELLAARRVWLDEGERADLELLVCVSRYAQHVRERERALEEWPQRRFDLDPPSCEECVRRHLERSKSNDDAYLAALKTLSR